MHSESSADSDAGVESERTVECAASNAQGDAGKRKRKRVRKRVRTKRGRSVSDPAAQPLPPQPLQLQPLQPQPQPLQLQLHQDQHPEQGGAIKPFLFPSIHDDEAASLVWSLESVPAALAKYWRHRYSLFTRFDDGVWMDYESWFSVTPEKVAHHIASRCGTSGKVVIDAFCGAGGNAIQFALAGHTVLAIDIDPTKLHCARRNSELYGALDRITFIQGDFLELAGRLKGDIVFLSPPWGGPEYLHHDTFDVKTMMPVDGEDLFKHAAKISKNVIYYLPKNCDQEQLAKLAGPDGVCELEEVYLNDRAKVLVVYYNGLAILQETQ